ncbi:MAG: lamin tail domain-containing protein [Planctomycetota bacterium]
MLATVMAALLFQGPAPVVINEFSYDDTSTDDYEFVEIYNTTKNTIDVSGWKLDGNDSSGGNPSYTIPANTRLGPGQFLVFGSTKMKGLVGNAIFVDIGATNLLENSNESMFLVDASNNVVDAVAYELQLGTWATARYEGGGIWGGMTSQDPGTGNHPTSYSRLSDGHDTDDNANDFRIMPATPGTSNDQAKLVAHVDQFDAATVETQVAGFDATFYRPRVIDPTKTSASNPAAIAASPQGKQCMVLWDPTYLGGLKAGDHAMMTFDTIKDVRLECYVFLDASKHATGDEESWSIGLRGTSDGYGNPVDVANSQSYNPSGSTGVAVHYQRTDKGGMLYLIDHNDGGDDFVVLGSIPIATGKNDGWQRLRFTVVGEYAEVIFGGTPGWADGTILYGKLGQGDSKSRHPAILEGGVWMSYRSNISTTTGVPRPLTIDDLRIVPTGPRVTAFGTSATGSNKNTPKLDTFGIPAVGAKEFALVASDMIPSSPGVLLLGGTSIPGGIALGNAFPAGAMLYVQPLLTFGIVADTSGVATAPVPIPADNGLLNNNATWQVFDVDLAIKVPLPLVSTNGLTIAIGN